MLNRVVSFWWPKRKKLQEKEEEPIETELGGSF
jgi:hypothetical protein